jgi:aminopeptidase
MRNIDELRRDYAKVVVKAGVDVQPGQLVHISCPVQIADFAVLVAEEAFKAGAKDVETVYSDTNFSRVKHTYADIEVLKNPPRYKMDARRHFTENGAALITLNLVDPNAFDGIDPKKTAAANAAMHALLFEANKLMFAKQCSFTLMCVPEQTWADAVFPGDEKALEKLWEKVCTACRVYEDDPVKSWKQFDTDIKRRGKKMQEMDLKTLRFKNKLGTDITIGLVENNLWNGGGMSWGGKTFFPNLPTEEIFTAPNRLEVNGKAVASMPLVYNGTVIKDFWFVFKDGKVVDFDAKQGKDVLTSVLDTDDGSNRLGEVALVPADCPISKLNTLFFTTLFDENAACHFALGNSYPNTLQNSRGLTDDEMRERGMNVSKVHVDFMIGTADLEVVAINGDEKEVQLFKNGVWVI